MEFEPELLEFILEYGVAVEVGLGVGVPIAAFELEFRRLPFALPAASEQADTASKPDSANVVINSLLMCSPG